MTVYVESNYVLELALGQEQAEAALAILERAERGEIALSIPAFSLSEPFATVTHRARGQQRMSRQFVDHLRELARSDPHREDLEVLASIPARLTSIERRELQRLTETVGRVLSASTVIPVTILAYTEAMNKVDRLGLSPQDAIVYSSVLGHLRTEELPGPHYFINKNWKDFDDPEIHGELGTLSCELINNFVDGALRLNQAPPG